MRKLLLAAFLLIAFGAKAQEDTIITRLKKDLAKEKGLNAKLDITERLAAYSEVYTPNLTADYLNDAILLAEQSRDRDLMIKARRVAATSYLGNGREQAKTQLAKKYAQEALDICKLGGVSTKEMVVSNMLMSRIQRYLGKASEGLQYNQTALDLANKSDNDSLKVIANMSNGNTLLYLDENIKAFKSYLAGEEILQKAKITNSQELTMAIKNCFVSFYQKIEDYNKAIDYQYQIYQYYDDKNKQAESLSMLGLIAENYMRAKKYDIAQATYNKISVLADSLKLPDYKFSAMLGKLNTLIYLKEKDKVLNLLKSNPQILEKFKQVGMMHILEKGLADTYHELNMNDSATFYFKKSLPVIDSKETIFNRIDAHLSYGKHLYGMGQYNNAITEFKTADQLSDSTNNLSTRVAILKMLDSCYQGLGDFKNAFLYSSKYGIAQKLLDEKSKEKELLNLQIESANKQKERLAKEEEEATIKRHNWQYSGILILIITLFTFLTALGVFKVPIKWIRAIGFFSFILLFEFIILLADTWIHHATHGEPWKVLSIKVVLIAILLPFHHYLEHKVISYITRKHHEEDLKLQAKHG